MYNFLQENTKFKVIATDDHQHVILVGATPEDVMEYAKEFNLIPNKETKKYVVYDSENRERFMLAFGALIRRLAPFDRFDANYKYFYRTPKLRLVVDGIYLGNGEPCPFAEYAEKKHGSIEPLELPHA